MEFGSRHSCGLEDEVQTVRCAGCACPKAKRVPKDPLCHFWMFEFLDNRVSAIPNQSYKTSIQGGMRSVTAATRRCQHTGLRRIEYAHHCTFKDQQLVQCCRGVALPICSQKEQIAGSSETHSPSCWWGHSRR
jgi:hypothetical protein